MSKAKDPKDVAIAYVMHAPLAEAVTFAQTLAAVVKARAAAPAAVKPSKAPAAVGEGAAASARARPRGVPRPPAVITDPNAPPLLEQAAAEVAASTS
jgi:hypothetical protein